MVVKLIVASGKSAGRSISVKRNKLLIGRAEECDIRPLSEEVSRRHCAVLVGPADVWVEDLGSRNGTYVNGERIAARTKVVEGDLIRVGALELKLSCTMPAAAGTGEDVSRWLMTDDKPAAGSDTTAPVPAGQADDSRADAAVSTVVPTDGGSFVSGIDTAARDDASATSRSTASLTVEALKAAKASPGALPASQPKKGADSSRDAAAEALRRFFDKR